MDILDSSDEAAVLSVWISFHWLTEITRDPLVLWLQKGRESSRITNNHRNKTELLKWKTYIFFNVTIATPKLTFTMIRYMCNAVLRKVGFNSDGSFVQLNFASRIWRSMFSNFSKTCVLCTMVTALTGNKMQHNKMRPFVPIRSPSIINVWTGEVVLHEREGVSYPGAFSVSPRRKTFFCWKTRW